MQIADLRTDWSLLSAVLRLAQRDGWNVSFGAGVVVVAHRRAAEGVVVLPAALMRHARAAGWSAARAPHGFDLRHAAVRHRIEVRLAVA